MTDDAVLPNDTQVYICGGIMQGGAESVRQFRQRWSEVREGGSGDGLLAVAKNDADFVYSGSLKRKYAPASHWEHFGESLKDLPRRNAEDMGRGWSELAQTPGIEFTTISQYIDEFGPAGEVSLRPAFGWYKSFQEWLAGSEKVGCVLDEARNEIKHAEYAVKIAGKTGLQVATAKAKLAEAWDHLMLAEISVGRRACAHPGGKPSRVIYSMEEALLAKKLAADAVDGIEGKS